MRKEMMDHDFVIFGMFVGFGNLGHDGFEFGCGVFVFVIVVAIFVIGIVFVVKFADVFGVVAFVSFQWIPLNIFAEGHSH